MISVGQVRDEKLVKRVMEDDFCDMVGIGRGLLANPYFVQKILDGRGADIIPWKD